MGQHDGIQSYWPPLKDPADKRTFCRSRSFVTGLVDCRLVEPTPGSTPGTRKQDGGPRRAISTKRGFSMGLHLYIYTKEGDRENEQKNAWSAQHNQKMTHLSPDLSRDRGVVGTTPARTSHCARGLPLLHMAFLPPRRVYLDLIETAVPWRAVRT